MKLSTHRLMVTFLSVFILAGCTKSYAIDKTRYRELFQKLSDAARQKDWQGARDVLTEIGRELPAPTPRYMLSVATVEARLGHKDEALQWIEKYVDTGLSFDPSKDGDLKALMAAGTGEKVAGFMEEHTLPVTNAEFVCELPQANTMPEDITYLKISKVKSVGSFYVSSIQHHTIYRVSLPKANGRQCTMEELPLPTEAKRWPTLAVAADPKRNVLWMTASAMPGFSGFPKEDEGKAVVGAALNPYAKLNYLPHPENVAVVGLDGLYQNGDSLIGIQNGTQPERIVRFVMNAEQTEITGAQVIHQAGQLDPTHAVEVGGWFYTLTNVGWSKVDDNTGELKPGEKFTPPVLMRFPEEAPFHSKN